MDALELCLKEVRQIHDSGAAVAETSYYPALAQLLNEIGSKLKPKVRCLVNPANRGAGNRRHRAGKEIPREIRPGDRHEFASVSFGYTG
jgi:hypothetical protein